MIFTGKIYSKYMANRLSFIILAFYPRNSCAEPIKSEPIASAIKQIISEDLENKIGKLATVLELPQLPARFHWDRTYDNPQGYWSYGEVKTDGSRLGISAVRMQARRHMMPDGLFRTERTINLFFIPEKCPDYRVIGAALKLPPRVFFDHGVDAGMLNPPTQTAYFFARSIDDSIVNIQVTSNISCDIIISADTRN